jgi:hypothetical protein
MGLKNFKNTERGACVIVGSGPSILDIPDSFLQKFKTIGVNKSYDRYISNYHCTIDIKPWIIEARSIMRLHRTPYFISPHWAAHGLKKIKIDGENEILIPPLKRNGRRYIDCIDNPDMLEEGVTSVFGVIFELAIPLALYLGFERIYLAGVDYNTSNGIYFNNNIEDIKRFEALKKALKMDPFEGRLNLVEQISTTQNCKKIFNLSQVTKIKCFEVISWEEVLEREGLK